MSFPQELAKQSWTLYGIGMFIIVVRTYARWRRVRSLSEFAVDDWLMLTAVPLLYTGLVVSLNAIARGGGSNLFPPEQFATMSQEEIKERIKGSKIVLVSEHCMLNLIWILKACMLFMFARMTTGTTHIKWIRMVSAWVITGYIAVQIAFWTACTPVRGYWSVPAVNPQCTTLEHFAIVQATFNISSDLLIIAVPIPMIASLALPIRQKIGLGLLFSMGTFVIVAAILTKVYNLSDVYSSTYMLWYTREASVAVYVANLPGIWPLLREHIRFLREKTEPYVSGTHSKLPKYGYGSQYGNVSSKTPRSRVRTLADAESDEIELGHGHSFASFAEKQGTFGATVVSGGRVSGRGSLDTEERALHEQSGWGVVQVDTKVEIQREAWESRDADGPAVDTKIQGPIRDVERKG